MSQDLPTDTERSAPEGDISLGRELRRAREVRGITVQQIAQETKINERYIHALENDRFDLLPGQPYTGNFVRSIARTIGADEEELIDYLNYHLRVLQPERHDDLRSTGTPRGRQGLPLVLGVGAILVIVALTLALRGGDDRPEPRPGLQPRPTVAPTAAPPAGTSLAVLGPDGATAIDATGAAGASGVRTAPPVLGALSAPTAPSAPPVASAPAPATASAPVEEAPAPTVRLVWRAKGWIQAEQGSDFYARMRHAGDELSWTLDTPLSLEIGNSGQVDMFLDGQPAKPLGSDNETRRLSLDRKNWKSFLR